MYKQVIIDKKEYDELIKFKQDVIDNGDLIALKIETEGHRYDLVYETVKINDIIKIAETYNKHLNGEIKQLKLEIEYLKKKKKFKFW